MTTLFPAGQLVASSDFLTLISRSAMIQAIVRHVTDPRLEKTGNTARHYSLRSVTLFLRNDRRLSHIPALIRRAVRARTFCRATAESAEPGNAGRSESLHYKRVRVVCSVSPQGNDKFAVSFCCSASSFAQ
jgi:hypothetical protein